MGATSGKILRAKRICYHRVEKMNPKISFLYSFADARGKKDCKLHEHPARPKIYENIVKQVSIVIT